VIARLNDEAEADLAEARRWYRSRGRHLAAGLLEAVDAALASIEAHPDGYPTVYRTVRRILVRRYPYALYYIRDGEELVVIGCFHTARDPSSWQERGDALLG
jgi:plasmid stabilization system protein ParE